MKRYKKQTAVFVMFTLFCALILCFYLPAHAKQNVKISQKKMVLVTVKVWKKGKEGGKKEEKNPLEKFG